MRNEDVNLKLNVKKGLLVCFQNEEGMFFSCRKS